LFFRYLEKTCTYRKIKDWRGRCGFKSTYFVKRKPQETNQSYVDFHKKRYSKTKPTNLIKSSKPRYNYNPINSIIRKTNHHTHLKIKIKNKK